ncbi:MAG: hypothetical protein KKA07_04855 [Bacteroidetes bacterium]|nr:hypothetical protein [Bacteroidota bacterium]MBU1718381.1 hypothetical protein [Bacteroidota bacterium]
MNSIKIFFFLLLSACTQVANSQHEMSFQQTEDSLLVLSKTILGSTDDSLKSKSNAVFSKLLKDMLAMDGAGAYIFEKLNTISILAADDGKFRVFTWHIPWTDGTYSYFGLLHVKNKSKEKFDLYVLTDKSEKTLSPETKRLTPQSWYGAHYYKLIATRQMGKTVYTLLGWRGNNLLTSQKVIEVLSPGNNGRIEFGGNIRLQRKTCKRVIFEYSAQLSMSLKYYEKEELIVFDHLSAPDNLMLLDPKLEGQYSFYGPDFTYEALNWKNGRWNLVKDYDARNPEPDTKELSPADMLRLEELLNTIPEEDRAFYRKRYIRMLKRRKQEGSQSKGISNDIYRSE